MANRKIEVEIVGDSKSLERAFRRSGDSADKFGRKVGHSGRAVAAGIGLAAAAVGGLAVAASKAFSSFEGSMNKIVGLVGVSRDQVNAWQEDLLKLGPEVAKSPTELADALFFVTSAGLRGQKALDALSVSAHAAAAGMGETKTVADAITSAINAYGQANLSASKAGDILVATVREGKTEAASLAPVIGNVAAFASALGVSFDQVGAALASQTRITGDAKSAAVQLTNIFSTLAKAAPRTVKGFKAAGLDLDTVRETLAKPNGLLKALKQLKGAFGDNVKAAAQAFPNIRALRGVLALVGKSADQTVAIFDRMRDSTGSVARAFEAISEDEGFQFGRTLEALRVVGIRLGAVLEPVANLIAKSATKALGVVSDFIADLEKAKTVRAKINVVFGTIREATNRAQDFLEDAIAKVDWDAVWAGARDVGDGFQRRLEEVDFGFVGKQIGDGIAKAVKVAIPAAQELAQRITVAFRTIDFEALGREMGPGLATAVTTAFLTLLDPAFWVRNWDLALSVAAVAFGGSLGRVAGKLVAPFARLGGEVVRAITPAIVEGMNALPRIVGRSIVGLVRVVSAQLGRLGAAVAKRFKALGRVAQFTIKVLGVLAAINVITDFAKKVATVFKGVGVIIKNAFESVFNFLKRQALQAALEIIEPFTHIPGFLGGGAFQRLKEQWQSTLDGMEKSTDGSVRTIQSSIDSLQGKTVTVAIRSENVGGGGAEPRGQIGRAQGAQAAAAEAKKQAKQTQTAAAIAAKAAADAAAAVKRAARQAKAAKKQAIKAFGELMESLSLDLDRAARTKSLRDDLAVLKDQEKAVLEEIKIEGKTLDLQRQLFDIQQQRAEVIKQQREAAADRRKGRQFGALGLTDTGERPTPSSGALLKRVGSVKNLVKGTALDTPKTTAELNRITKVLKGKFGKVGQEVRAAILQMLNDISDTLDDKRGPLTKTSGLNTFKVTAGLGLTPEQERALRSRLSGVNTRGLQLAGGGREATGSFVVESHTTINLDGKKVASSTTRHQQRSRRRNPLQKRGPNRAGHGGH